MSRALLVFLLLGLASCAVGPGYQRPVLESPPAFLNPDTSFYITDTTFVDSAWWRQFSDTVLCGLIDTALLENSNVMIAAARVEELMGRYGVAKSDFWPKVDGGATALRGQFGFPGEATTSDRPTTSYLQVNLSAGWEIDLWGKIRRSNEAAKADLLASEEARRGVVLTTISLVASTYIDLQVLDLQVAIAEKTAESRHKALILFDDRRQKGDLSELEYSQAEAEYWYAMAQLPSLERKRTQVEANLNFLLGRSPGPVPRGPLFQVNSLPEIPVGLPSALLERRPDVRQAEEQLHAANARIGVAKARYFPTISLSGLLGTSSGALSDLFGTGSGVWRVGADALGPIFHSGEIKNQVKTAEAIQKQALYGYVGAVHNAFLDAEVALSDRSRTAQEFEAMSKRVTALATYSELANLRYREGVTDYMEVLDADRALFATQLDAARSHGDLYRSVVSVYRALAGGWLDPAASQAFQIETLEK
jgi:multidrug efflux system outer membrane protein